MTIRWNTPLATGVPVTRGTYGYYEVRSNGVAPEAGPHHRRRHQLDDARLLRPGRVDHQQQADGQPRRPHRARARPDATRRATTFRSSASSSASPTSWRRAPASPTTSTATATGRSSGSWGVFYDTFKLELPRGSFGGDKWLSYYYTLDTFNWPTLVDGANCPPACSGTLIRGPIDFRHPSFGVDAIDPDLKPMRLQEATISLDHQLNDVMAVGAALRPQAGRPRHRRHGLPRCRTAAKATSSPTRAKASPRWRSPTRTSRCRRPFATTTRSSSRSTSACSNNWYLRTSYTGAACMATTRACRSRTKTAAPARTSAACSTTRR